LCPTGRLVAARARLTGRCRLRRAVAWLPGVLSPPSKFKPIARLRVTLAAVSGVGGSSAARRTLAEASGLGGRAA